MTAIDAHRGFVLLMFAIVEAFLPVVRTLPSSPPRDFLITQFTHAEWAGYTFLDLGFPTFIMLLAMSLPLSLDRRRERGDGEFDLFKRVAVRSLLLFAFGTFFHGGLSVPLSELRFTRIFHRLAIAIFISGVAELTLRTRGQIIALVSLLVGYWGLMEWAPVPGYGAGDYSQAGNLNHYVDRVLLGADTYFVLSTLGVAATCLFGLLAGRLLLEPLSWRQRASCYAGGGLLLINLGMIWGQACPINKHIWTPSFVVLSSGWFSLGFAGFYSITDGLGWKRWAMPLTILGQHPLLTFAGFGLLPFGRYADLIAGKGLVPILGSAQPFVQAAVQVLLLWLLIAWVHRRGGTT